MTSTEFRNRALIALLLAFPVAGALLGGPLYSVLELGALPGGSFSSAQAISASGFVTGSADDSNGVTQPVLWSYGLASVFNPALTNIALAFGTGVSDNGTFVGYSFSTDLATYNAFLYNRSLAPIPTLGGVNNSATAINATGAVAGYSDDKYGNTRAFLYDTDGHLTNIGQSVGGSSSSASAINSSGQIVGQFTDDQAHTHAFLWDGTTATDLGLAPGYQSSQATGIDSHGAVVGYQTDPFGNTRAFLWMAGAGWTALGTLGGPTSIAYGIGNFGYAVGASDTSYIVGSSDTGDGGQAAFVDVGGTMYDLNTLVVRGEGWQLTSASAINTRGQIVGTGMYQGQQRAFLLSRYCEIPELCTQQDTSEPATTLLTLGGVGAIFWIRKARRAAAGVPASLAGSKTS